MRNVPMDQLDILERFATKSTDSNGSVSDEALDEVVAAASSGYMPTVTYVISTDPGVACLIGRDSDDYATVMTMWFTETGEYVDEKKWGTWLDGFAQANRDAEWKKMGQFSEGVGLAVTFGLLIIETIAIAVTGAIKVEIVHALFGRSVPTFIVSLLLVAGIGTAVPMLIGLGVAQLTRPSRWRRNANAQKLEAALA